MITELLPSDSLRRRAVLLAALTVGLLVFTQLVLPGRGQDPRGTPAAILFQGALEGLVIALTAVGIVLLYRTLRIINFAQGAIGAAGAIFFFELVKHTPVPFPIAFVLGIALSGLVGVAIDLVFGRRFMKAPRLVLTVFTIALAQIIAQTAPAIRNLPIFPDLEGQTADSIFNATALQNALPLRGLQFEVGSFPLPFGFPHIFAIDVALIAFLGVAAFFRYTRAGVAVRSLAENSERAALLGISVGTLSTIVWAIAGMLSGASVAVNGMLTTPGVAAGFAPTTILIALAAAVLGRMQSLPATVFAAVGLGTLASAINWSLGDELPGIVAIGLFVVVTAGFLLHRRTASRSETTEAVWDAAEETRPIPVELRDLATVKWATRALAALGVAVVLLYPFITSVRATDLGGVIALQAIVALSLVVLTGWAGQPSLGQFGFAAVGAVVGGSLSGTVGLPFWFAVPAAAVVGAAVAVLVGLPALRLRGLFLAVSTLGFSIAAGLALFQDKYFGWMLPDEVLRPDLFFLDFEDDRSMYFLSVGALVVSILLVLNLRKSRVGRVLIASRENEANLQSFGVSLMRARLLAFAISGALCGFSGAIFVHHQRGISQQSFQAGESIFVFLFAVIGGVGTVFGPVLGTIYFKLVEYFFIGNVLVEFVNGFVILIILYVAPGGIMSLLTRVRDAWLRIVAQRRQIIVPSLFADVDPDALEARLIALGEPLPGGGLAALPAAERWAMESELYQGGGESMLERLERGERLRETAAIGAASAAAEPDSQGAST